MNQRILLADSSYTIRRIVELSFQDIENVELFSFESGKNLREKLLEINPQIVLIDIKLPEFNGYEACKFINNEPSLVKSKVLLMKGGFEPIDEYLLKDLNYEDIITKPFDSKLLESQVIKMLEDIGTTAPAPPLSIPEELDVPSFSDNIDGEDISIETTPGTDSFPDDLPDFSDGGGNNSEGDGISFSDITADIEKENESSEIEETVSNDESSSMDDQDNDMSFKDAVAEIETPEILSENELDESEGSIIDEVEPSEEITQGAYEEQNDTLLSDPEDEISNPFKDESGVKSEEISLGTDEHNLKEEIKMHEDEMGMDSLTIEEMKIKSDIENRNKGLDDEESEYGTDSFGGLDSKPSFSNISFNEEDKEVEKSVEDEEQKVEPGVDEKIDPSIFEAADGILNDDIDMLNDGTELEEESLSDMDISITDDPSDSGNLSEFFASEEKESLSEPAPAPDEVDEPVVKSIVGDEESDESNLNLPEFGEIEEEISSYSVSEEPEIEKEISIDGKIEEPVIEEEISSVSVPEEPKIEQEVSNEEKIEEPVIEEEISSFSVPEEPEIEQVVSYEEKIEEPVPVIEEKIEEPKIESVPTEEVSESVIDNAATPSSEDMGKIMERVEDKLTVSIKEILWDVIPPLAERIIQEEITALKAEIDNKDI